MSTITWTPPAANTDGSALSPGEITGYAVQFDGAAQVPLPGSSGTTSSYDLSGLAEFKALTPGKHTVAVIALTANGGSGASNTADINVPFPAPRAPTNLVYA